MKLFDKYFQPYAEYCIRTTFSEDELKEVLVKECPKSTDILSIRKLKAIVGMDKTIVFSCDPDNPLQLSHIRLQRSSSHGDVFIHCEKSFNNETILHISIAQPPKYKYLLYGICIFALLWGICAMSVVWWAIFLPLPFIGALFVVLECLKEMAESEIPHIQRNFENMLRALERKYSTPNISIKQQLQ